MFGLKKFEPHFDLMHEMAETAGVSLNQALDNGLGGAQRLRSAMMRCAYCDDVEGCRKFLGDKSETTQEPMATCPNKSFLMELKEA